MLQPRQITQNCLISPSTCSAVLSADFLPCESGALIHPCSQWCRGEPCSSQGWKGKGSWLSHPRLCCCSCLYYVCTQGLRGPCCAWHCTERSTQGLSFKWECFSQDGRRVITHSSWFDLTPAWHFLEELFFWLCGQAGRERQQEAKGSGRLKGKEGSTGRREACGMKGRNTEKAEKLNCMLQLLASRSLNSDGFKKISNFSKAPYLGILLPCICKST